ncbi:hypothetical protein LOTGIDRAFT_153451 [Lottia gigantea]|uniref:GST C-terminal domain-containing protein n=1 Tax=Lottia gigantea TaxID=225164 RepID=V3ZRC9_LOTGI|nr:hypothetical protein LOTGIDRAFT_153451 [Lottia gigantea]ESO93973.1 hypothetical protein LOTGIDRAFT_153451 [Lottia gigantea]
MSSKGKIPWVEYNGEVIEDSTFIIEFFKKKLSIDMNKDLSLKEKGLSRAIQKMIEENFFWCLALCRWMYDETDKQWMGLGWLVPKFIKRTVKKSTWAAGISRHTQKEVLEIMESDIKAISDILGSQKYIMGNEPTEVDCCVFGFLAQIFYACHEKSLISLVGEKYPNLKDYCLRMKNRYWADWDDCITHDGTRTPIR